MGEKTACGKSTQDLLVEFQQTGSQEPFEEIARRYAGMVYNVALQVTRDAHDAEDATQATFLSLAVHAKTAGKIRFVGPWLRKVSQRLALDIRRSKKRRTTREQRHAITRAAVSGNGNGHGMVSRDDLAIANSLQLEELRDILRNELDRLPTKYRMPLILYYFGGLTPDQIGKELKCKTSTLGVRLHRGRKMLADNLSGRGINISSATAGVMLAALVDSSIRDNLVHACSYAAVHVSGSTIVADATVSAPVLAMVNSVTRTLRLSRLKGLIAAGVLLLTTITGTAKALERFDFIGPDMIRRINPLRLIRPLMDRLLRPQMLSLEFVSTPTAENPPSALTLEQDFSTLSGWPSLSGSMWPAPPQIITGASTRVGSERLLASQYPSSEMIALPSAVIVSSVPSPLTAAPVVPILPHVTAQPAESSIAAAPLMVLEPSSPVIAPQSTIAIAPTRTYDTLVIDRSTLPGTTIADSGVATISGGLIQARRIVVGDSTDGTLYQTNGTVQVSEAVVIANQPSSTGTYAISNNSTLTTPSLIVGGSGTGNIIQLGGLVAATTSEYAGQVVIGDLAGSEGAYLLEGGSLVADTLVIGRQGVGILKQTGGELAFQVARLGSESGGKGTWSLSNGSVQVSDPTSPSNTNTNANTLPVAGAAVPTSAGAYSSANSGAVSTAPIIMVGGEGSGTILLKSGSAAAIQEQPGSRGATLLVRPDGTGTGVIRGWGRVQLSGPFISNGRVIADGFGTPHVLDLSSVSVITNVLDNPTVGGQNGWYARAGGSLKLPAIRLYGPGPYTWGEFVYDRQIDLVNSVRFTLEGATAGEVDITLLDPLARVVPLLPTGTHGMSLWEIDGTVEFSGIDLLVRYDDAMVSAWRSSESDLVLWVFEEGQWQLLIGDGAGIDMEANLIWGRAENPGYFAVGLAPDNLTPVWTLQPEAAAPTPEPMALAGIGLVAAAALLRRRRR